MSSVNNLKQKHWIKACRKLGLKIDTKRGKGSHVLIKHSQDNRKYTIQKKLNKIINKEIFKKLLEWDFDESEVWKALK